MNKDQLNLAWETSSHDERNEFINDFSIGSIEGSRWRKNSAPTCIELFRVGSEIFALDPEDINEPQPFLTIYELAYFYEWDNNELLDQINEYKDGTTKDVLIKLININLGK